MIKTRLKSYLARGLLRVIRFYFSGRSVSYKPSAGVVLPGRVTHGVIRDGSLLLYWSPLGGFIRDQRRVALHDLRRDGSEWFFES